LELEKINSAQIYKNDNTRLKVKETTY